jgi:DNA-binding MarR family transcriptional regulator
MFHQAIADRLGLNVTDHKCLDFLTMKGALTAGELAGLTGLTTGAITAVIDRLEKAGFARRADDPRDRRRVIVEVVAKRVREIESLFAPFAATFNALSAGYTDKELVVILDFMNRSCEGLHESTLKLREPRSPIEKDNPRRPRARGHEAKKPAT